MKKALLVLLFSGSNLLIAQNTSTLSTVSVCGNGIVEAGEQCDGTPGCIDCQLAPAGTFFLDPNYGLFYNASLQPGIKSSNRALKYNPDTNDFKLISNYNSDNLPYSIGGTSNVSQNGINSNIIIASGFENSLKRNYPMPIVDDYFIGNLYGQFGAPSGIDVRSISSPSVLAKRITPSNVVQNQIDIFAATKQSDGKIILAGRGLTSQGKIILIRLNTNLSFDITFGGGGYRFYTLGSDCQARAIGVQSDGKIIVAGHKIAPGSQGFIMRIDSSIGGLDNTFGTNGMKTFFYELETQNNYFELNNLTEVYSMYIDLSDNIYVCGKGSASNLWNGKTIPVVNAFTANGNDWLLMRDSTHTTDSSILNISGEAYKIMANESTGDIYIAGYSVDGVDKGLYVQRFNSVAEVDTNFVFKTNSTAPHGFYKISAGDDIVFDMAIQNDGKILLVGESNNDGFYTRITDNTLETNQYELKNNSVKLWPNPVSNTLNLTFENKINHVTQITINDVFGKEVVKLSNPFIDGQSTITIGNINTLSKGIYFVNIVSDSNFQVLKFLKE